MNPWVAFGIGMFVGFLIGIFIAGLAHAANGHEFNEQGEYECNYSGEDPQADGTKLPLDGSFVETDANTPVILQCEGIGDLSIYLMPNDGFDILSRRKMNDEVSKKFGVIKFVNKDKNAEVKE